MSARSDVRLAAVVERVGVSATRPVPGAPNVAAGMVSEVVAAISRAAPFR